MERSYFFGNAAWIGKKDMTAKTFSVLRGRFKQIDEYEQLIILTDGKKIPIQEVYTIESDLFRGMFD